MNIRRQRHDDAHFPLQGRGSRAQPPTSKQGSFAAGTEFLRQWPLTNHAQPKTSWQALLQSARFKRDTLIMLGLDRFAARKDAIDDMAEMRLRAKFSLQLN